MAISRAQLLKELLPGLNALFGMEYARYGEEHKDIFETETRAMPSLTTMRRKLGLLVTTTKLLLLVSRSLKKRSKITCMTPCHRVIPSH